MMKSFLRITTYGALFFILFLISGPGFNQAAAAEDELQKAERLTNEMLYEEAVQVLNNFIQANAADAGQKTRVAKAYYLLARIYFDVDDTDPQVKQNLAKVFEYDKNFNTKEINAAFKKLVEGVRGKAPQPTPAPIVEKRNLTVEMGADITGSPGAGSHSYEKGKKVQFSYKAKSDTAKITVKLDGKTAPAKGYVTMYKDRTLTAAIAKARKVEVVVNSNPTGAAVYVGGMDSGQVTNHTLSFPKDGPHDFLLRKVGYKEFATTINADFNNPKTLEANLERGLSEDFNVGASTSILWRWKPNPTSKWANTNGRYVLTAKCNRWNYVIYDHNFAAPKYTLRVKMKRSAGRDDISNSIALITGTNPSAVRGYLFNYSCEGKLSFWRMNDYNIETGAGGIKEIGPWAKVKSVRTGLGSDNSIKIQRNGKTYTYYMNNIRMWSFDETAYNPGYIMIGGDCLGVDTQLSIDYVYLDVGK